MVAMPSLIIVSIGPDQVEMVAPLFDAYRQFYGKAPDIDGARRFLMERLIRAESVIFAAVNNGEALGFTQLYPSFSSLSMMPIWILNDLFVRESARRKGVAAQLLKAARNHGFNTGAARMTLSTASSNTSAQSLYEQDGWRRDTEFFYYEFERPRLTPATT